MRLSTIVLNASAWILTSSSYDFLASDPAGTVRTMYVHCTYSGCWGTKPGEKADLTDKNTINSLEIDMFLLKPWTNINSIIILVECQTVAFKKMIIVNEKTF